MVEDKPMPGTTKQFLLILLTVLLLSLVAGLYFFSSSYPVNTTETKSDPQQKVHYPEPHYLIAKQIKYRYHLKNTSNQVLKNSDFWVYAPIKQTASQKVLEIKSSHSYELISDKDHHQILHFKLKNFAPYDQKIITVQVKLNLSEQPNLQSVQTPETYLQATPLIELEHPGIRSLAQQLRQTSPHQSAEAIYQWSVEHLDSRGSHLKERSAAQLLSNKKGDATAFMHLFSALGRSNQIPTREVGGYLVKQNRILHASDFHHWAEYYQDKTWHLVDIQNNTFRQQYQNYIAFRHYGSDPAKSQFQRPHYKVSDEHISVKMK
jgi:transglutaminase-like putative cysteine protease